MRHLIPLRLHLLLLLAALSLLASACDDGGEGDGNNDTGTDTASGGDTTASPDTTTGGDDTIDHDSHGEHDLEEPDTTVADTRPNTDIEPSDDEIIVSDQSLSDLSTVVVIDRAVLSSGGWVAVFDEADLGGAPLGFAEVPAGGAEGISVVLERPVSDGETLYAVLHVDQPADGQFTFGAGTGEDLPALAPDDGQYLDTFVATVAAGTPAVRFTIRGLSNSAYSWTQAEPAHFRDWIGAGNNNQVLSLKPGWHYEIVNLSSAAHPLELVTRGATRDQDVVLLSQDVAGSLEAASEVNWSESGNRMRFTLAGPLANALDSYRCSVRTHSAMRGSIALQ